MAGLEFVPFRFEPGSSSKHLGDQFAIGTMRPGHFTPRIVYGSVPTFILPTAIRVEKQLKSLAQNRHKTAHETPHCMHFTSNLNDMKPKRMGT
jgi:hypothetical protein